MSSTVSQSLDLCFNEQNDAWGQFGDFTAGMLNTSFTAVSLFCTLAVLIWQMKINQKQIEISHLQAILAALTPVGQLVESIKSRQVTNEAGETKSYEEIFNRLANEIMNGTPNNMRTDMLSVADVIANFNGIFRAIARLPIGELDKNNASSVYANISFLFGGQNNIISLAFCFYHLGNSKKYDFFLKNYDICLKILDAHGDFFSKTFDDAYKSYIEQIKSLKTEGF